MKKITSKIGFDFLGFEVTRRCNLKCAHCCRGEAQDIDLNTVAIDTLLDQTDTIGELSITGGEPLLALPVLEYLFHRIKENNIRIDDFKIITNGTCYTESFADLMINFKEYVSNNRASAGVDSQFIIYVSSDKYHGNGHVDDFILKCRSNFSNCGISVIRVLGGNAPVRLGRARKLQSESEADDFTLPYNFEAAIEYWRPRLHLPKCDAFSFDNVKNRATPMIICPLYVSARGHLYTVPVGSLEYAMMDNSVSICDLNKQCRILHSIHMYNHGRMSCKDCENETISRSQVSIYDLIRSEIKSFLMIAEVAEAQSHGFSKRDSALANKDLQEIFEYQELRPEYSLYIAVEAWIMDYEPIIEETKYSKLRNTKLQYIYDTIKSQR